MQHRQQILYLTRKQVNDELWNDRITSSANGLIYGYTSYLDAMADDWDALVLDDYQAVMPLPWRKKWNIYYLYQPFLAAQLGVFGNNLTTQLFSDFLQAIPAKFRYWDFSLNQQNLFQVPAFPLHQRSNYILSLNQPYQALHGNYRDNIKRNIKKSIAYGCSATNDVSIDHIIELTKLQAQDTSLKDFDNFKKLFQWLKEKDKAKTYGIVSKQDQLIASAVFLFSHNRAYYILVGNHPNGRTLGASHALIDAFIKDHAEQNLLLDFEGSDFHNLAFFYNSFGAVEEKYAAIKLNRLPWWMKWLKK